MTRGRHASPPDRDPTTPTRRLAAIDVGTNSIRLIVAEASPDGSYRVIDDEKVVTRLGGGSGARGELSAEAIEASATAIARLKSIAEGYGVELLRAVATCAVREAVNRESFTDLVREVAGVELDVISADEEARLAWLSVSSAFDLSAAPVAVVDIGGGSTEIVLAARGLIESIHTVPLGAVRLTERFGPGGPDQQDRFEAMRRAIREALAEHVGKPPFTPHLVVGTGGTFTTLAGISMHRRTGSRDNAMLPFTVRGYELLQAEARHILDMLRVMPVRDRGKVPGLSPDRADIIVAGLALIDGVLKRLKANTLLVHDQGIRGGLLRSMTQQLFPDAQGLAAGPPDRLEAARRFAASCRYERRHAEHVAHLALALFDQLVNVLDAGDEPWASAESRELLHVAALLHDVGYCINYAKHHKHSYHLIVHSDLPGFTHRELDVIANVARYHRRADPRNKHMNFAKLSSADKSIVRHLVSILRLAVGLDRAHAQQVQAVRVAAEGDRGRLTVGAIAAHEPAVDLWGADRKRELFEKTFDRPVQFTWLRAEVPRQAPSTDEPAEPRDDTPSLLP